MHLEPEILFEGDSTFADTFAGAPSVLPRIVRVDADERPVHLGVRAIAPAARRSPRSSRGRLAFY